MSIIIGGAVIMFAISSAIFIPFLYLATDELRINQVKVGLMCCLTFSLLITLGCKLCGGI